MWRSSADRWVWPSLTARASYYPDYPWRRSAAAADADLGLVDHRAGVLGHARAFGARPVGVERVHALGAVDGADVDAGGAHLGPEEKLAGIRFLGAEHVFRSEER